jgi:hypothetical protein
LIRLNSLEGEHHCLNVIELHTQGDVTMSKKLDNSSRIYHEMLDRYGEFDDDVMKLKSELEVLESVEFRYPSRVPGQAISSRTTGAHRRKISALAAG